MDRPRGENSSGVAGGVFFSIRVEGGRRGGNILEKGCMVRCSLTSDVCMAKQDKEDSEVRTGKRVTVSFLWFSPHSCFSHPMWL